MAAFGSGRAGELGAAEATAGPGLAPLDLGADAAPPDRAAEPAGYLVVSDGPTRIHFLDWGGPDVPGAPRVLLLHGLLGTAWAWTPVARRLISSSRVVAMDLRGHGLSDAPPDGYDADHLVGDVLAAGEGSGLLPIAGDAGAGPIVIAGHGYGAIVAAWTAAALGDACAGLVLVDGGWERLADATGQDPGEWLATIEEPPEVLRSMIAWLADRAAFDPESWDEDAERAARAQVVETAAGRVKLAVHPQAVAGSVAAMWSYDPDAVLAAVPAQVAVLSARDDADGSRTARLRGLAARRAAAGRSPIRVARFPDLGHGLPRSVPDAVVAAILGVGRHGED